MQRKGDKYVVIRAAAMLLAPIYSIFKFVLVLTNLVGERLFVMLLSLQAIPVSLMVQFSMWFRIYFLRTYFAVVSLQLSLYVHF